MAMSCSRRGPLRFVCGQTVNTSTTAMIYTYMESPSDLDVHLKKRFAVLAEIVEIDVAEAGTKTTKFALCSPTMFSTFIASLCILLVHGG